MDVEDQKLEFPLIPKVQEDERHGFHKDEYAWELKKQLFLAGPIISVNLLSYCMQVISVMFVGHLGELELAGASMASSFATVTGFSFLNGMASALDTLCGQSYGAKQYHMLGLHMQRAMFVLILVSIPLAFLWGNAGSILLLLGQDPEISASAADYAQVMIPSIFAYGISQSIVRFLQTQNNVLPTVVTTGVTAMQHILLCWILVFKFGLGIKGAALANVISYFINALLLALYVWFSPSCKKSWTGFSREALNDIWSFISLAIPSSLMICLEWWSFEMMVLLAGLLPNPTLETSVMSISLNTSSMIFMIPMGLGSAISTRVSNELGAGQPRSARLAVKVVVLVAITEALMVALIMILGRNAWGYCYSNDETVVRYVGEILIMLAGSHILEVLQSVFSGIARGCGWQKTGAIVNLGSYYLAGIPAGVILAFRYHLGGKGLWTGNIIALFVQATALLIIILSTNWEDEAKKATKMVYETLISEDELS